MFKFFATAFAMYFVLCVSASANSKAEWLSEKILAAAVAQVVGFGFSKLIGPSQPGLSAEDLDKIEKVVEAQNLKQDLRGALTSSSAFYSAVLDLDGSSKRQAILDVLAKGDKPFEVMKSVLVHPGTFDATNFQSVNLKGVAPALNILATQILLERLAYEMSLKKFHKLPEENKISFVRDTLDKRRSRIIHRTGQLVNLIRTTRVTIEKVVLDPGYKFWDNLLSTKVCAGHVTHPRWGRLIATSIFESQRIVTVIF